MAGSSALAEGAKFETGYPLPLCSKYRAQKAVVQRVSRPTDPSV